LASGADQVVIDLEDSVAPAMKVGARAGAAAWMNASHPVLVRINALDTPWYRDDIALARHPGVRGFIVSKAEHLQSEFVDQCISQGKVLIPLIETAFGFHHVDLLAASPAVERLAFGSIDFQVDLGITGDDDALGYFRSRLVLASRVANLQPPLDGVTTETNDLDALSRDTLRANRFGFGGKLCIHPRQVPTVNRLFSPSQHDLEWARAVKEAVRDSGQAVVTLDGRMVDKPIIAKAESILHAAKSPAA
jgi:citrate lyase subunit beta / citryl-CoA lyase